MRLVSPPPLFQFFLSFTLPSLPPYYLPPSVSSAVSGPGLPSRQQHRLHSDQRAQGRAEAVQTTGRAAGLFQIAGMIVFYFGPEFSSYNDTTK